MIDEILLSVAPGETRTALLSGGRLVEYMLDRAGDADITGNIYLGRVQKLMPGIDAAFVDIGLGRAGFLTFEDMGGGEPGEARRGRVAIAERVHEGEAILVQVGKAAVADKGPRLTTRLGLPGRYLVFTPERDRIALSRRIADAEERARLAELVEAVAEDGEGFVLRTLAAGAEAAELAADARFLRALWREVREAAAAAVPPFCAYREPQPVERVLRDYGDAALRRIRIDDRAAFAAARDYCARFLPHLRDRLELYAGDGEGTPLFRDADIEQAIAETLLPRVTMPSGAGIVIERVEALTAIDVNTGGSVGNGLDDTILATNLEAAAEVARQIRLRNIAGLIVVDFIRMERPTDADKVVAALRAAVAGDPMAVEVGEMSPMGLVELTRKRGRPSLADMLTERCASCGGEGRVTAAVTVALEALRALRAEGRRTPGAALLLAAAPEVIDALEGPAAPAREELEAELGRALALRREPEYHREHYDIVPD